MAVDGDFEKRLGLRLAALRLARGLGQAELARAAGVSLTELSRCEMGEGQLSGAALWRLAQALAVPVADIVGEAANGRGGPV